MSEWWYSDRSGAVGPLSLNEALEALSRISTEQLATVLVWREGFAEWRIVSDVPELGPLAVLSKPKQLESSSPDTQRIDFNKTPSIQRPVHRRRKPLLIGSTFVVLLVAAGVMIALLLREPNLEAEAERAVVARLTDPESARFQGLEVNGQWRFVCGFVNAKNKMGGYVGFKQFYFDKEVGAFIDGGTGDSDDLLARTYTKRC